MMASNMSTEESQQLLRTIEMFEAITESQPDDYQSLEILKEAYVKLGRSSDSLRTSRKLAAAYVKLGQISQAILEYEGILQEAPQDAAARAALSQLEAQTPALTALILPDAPPLPQNSKRTPPVVAAAAAAGPAGARTGLPGRALADVLIAEHLVTPQSIQPLLQRLQVEQAAALAKKQPLTLVQMLVDDQIARLDDILTVLVDRSGLPYLPLGTYDVDRDIARLLPVEICLRWCVLPVDLISRSLLVATADPFCSSLREEVSALLEYHIFWYVAAPADIGNAIQRAHGLDVKNNQRGGA